MLSVKQCEIARIIVKDIISDFQINKEFESMTAENKILAVKAIDKLLQEHDLPFDKGIAIMLQDFYSIANKFSINPATLFCVYMDINSK